MTDSFAAPFEVRFRKATTFMEKVKNDLPPDKHEEFLVASKNFTEKPPESMEHYRSTMLPFFKGHPDLMKEFDELNPPAEAAEDKSMQEYKEIVSKMSKEEQEAHFKDFFEKMFHKTDASVKADEPVKTT